MFWLVLKRTLVNRMCTEVSQVDYYNTTDSKDYDNHGKIEFFSRIKIWSDGQCFCVLRSFLGWLTPIIPGS